ncbi:uncharacterized protein LY89DRAFT_715828 [Mollisia scopiformis]|uniref:alpha-galactosidase n=1 Tax=Mollisia scopiformis TaxID=149040 RepID=A0A194XKX2_MOLSC|nr:uncharacterized protein LY89DRAFT_715828 [Mollisia scopiformis]KUJ20422.1 hypothetical protein LY89DRAFT_715828 [Mollisia scopiformis]
MRSPPLLPPPHPSPPLQRTTPQQQRGGSRRSDSTDFLPSDYGAPLVGWPGEWWLNTSSPNVRSIMLKRLDLAATKGCDGVDPDNIDGFKNDNGLNLTRAGAINYITFLSEAAHARNVSMGLKNRGDLVKEVIDEVEYAVNEQCVKYRECKIYQPLVASNKPVFHIEYEFDEFHHQRHRERRCLDADLRLQAGRQFLHDFEKCVIG